MVKIMLAPDHRQPSPFGDDHGDGWEPGRIAGRDTFGQSLSARDPSMDPSTCMFWCAVALGALVRGSPFQSVSRAFVIVRTATPMES